LSERAPFHLRLISNREKGIKRFHRLSDTGSDPGIDRKTKKSKNAGSGIEYTDHHKQ
jgi:hypothetical protein